MIMRVLISARLCATAPSKSNYKDAPGSSGLITGSNHSRIQLHSCVKSRIHIYSANTTVQTASRSPSNTSLSPKQQPNANTHSTTSSSLHAGHTLSSMQAPQTSSEEGFSRRIQSVWHERCSLLPALRIGSFVDARLCS